MSSCRFSELNACCAKVVSLVVWKSLWTPNERQLVPIFSPLMGENKRGGETLSLQLGDPRVPV